MSRLDLHPQYTIDENGNSVVILSLKEYEELVKEPNSKPSLSQEIAKRVKEVENGEIELTPYNQGMEKMMDRLYKKYANS